MFKKLQKWLQYRKKRKQALNEMCDNYIKMQEQDPLDAFSFQAQAFQRIRGDQILDNTIPSGKIIDVDATKIREHTGRKFLSQSEREQLQAIFDIMTFEDQ